MRNTGPSPAVRWAVKEREQFACARCAHYLGELGGDVHHRQSRGAGGSRDPRINNLSNLLYLCRSCHAWCDDKSSEAEELGFVVRRNTRDTPFESPVAYRLGEPVFLGDDGSIEWEIPA